MKRIPFTPEMFRAWREGRKTVTRRLTKYDHPIDCEIKEHENHCFAFYNQIYYACEKPHYRPGERVLVVTRWCVHQRWDDQKPLGLPVGIPISIGRDYQIVMPGKWRQGRFVPLHLEKHFPKTTIISARPERLKDITEAEAMREGVIDCLAYRSAVDNFEALWSTIHKDKPWDSNPMVWRYELAPPGNEWRIA